MPLVVLVVIAYSQLIAMRPLKGGEEVGGRNLMDKQSLAAIEELWDEWEIHCLILASLFLQVFLFLAAGIRTRSTSSVLRTLLWLAYLSADSVAIFVLGHLAVHASKPGHQLMSFWAPFVLVHLGGQETITAFSKQDNELWTRHLLSLVSQVAVAVYVMAKASWPDGRLRAAMLIMFFSGCFKYAERIVCLYLGSPVNLKSDVLDVLSQQVPGQARRNIRRSIYMMLKGSSIGLVIDIHESDTSFILGEDAPINVADTILDVEDLPGILAVFQSQPDRSRAYEYVGELLVQFYQHLYTKIQLRECFYSNFSSVFHHLGSIPAHTICLVTGTFTFILLYTLFQYVAASIALVLFSAAEKEGHLYTTSRADVTVSYILLVGAVVQDLSSAIMLIFSNVRYNLPARVFHVANRIRPALRGNLWSEELAQYSMIKRHTMQDNAGMSSSMQQWIGRRLGAWGVDLLELSSIPIIEDHTPIKEFILDNLLHFGTREQWNIASFRGRLAVQKWTDRHQEGPDSDGRPTKALLKSVSSGVDFPTSVLIWHIATDICYYYGDSSSSSDQIKDRQISRQLSNYIMYLVFKCGVMLTNKSQIVHDKAHSEIRNVLSDQQGRQVISGEKDAVIKLFQAKNEEQHEPLNKESHVNRHLLELQRTLEALDSPVLPRACAVAQELISVFEETDRWGLIAAVWSEMLYFTAPRCGSAFHCEHLTTGGEFITHVLLLMSSLGPFLPPPGGLVFESVP